MKKVLTWIINHLRIVIGAIAVVALVIVGVSVMVVSYNKYLAEDKKFNENDLLVRSAVEAAPKNININDKFASYKNDGSLKSTKSKLKNSKTAWADELKTDAEVTLQGQGKTGTYIPNFAGTVSLDLTVSELTFVDIDFVISSSYVSDTTYDTKELLDQVNFKVNNAAIEGKDITLANETGEVEFHHLVMKGFAIAAGDLKISISTTSAKANYMPAVRNISVFANVEITNAAA